MYYMLYKTLIDLILQRVNQFILLYKHSYIVLSLNRYVLTNYRIHAEL
jgi:hypothetical protein